MVVFVNSFLSSSVGQISRVFLPSVGLRRRPDRLRPLMNSLERFMSSLASAESSNESFPSLLVQFSSAELLLFSHPISPNPKVGTALYLLEISFRMRMRKLWSIDILAVTII